MCQVAVLCKAILEIDGICHDQYGHLYLDERRPDFINQTYHRQIDQGDTKKITALPRIDIDQTPQKHESQLPVKQLKKQVFNKFKFIEPIQKRATSSFYEYWHCDGNPCPHYFSILLFSAIFQRSCHVGRGCGYSKQGMRSLASATREFLRK